MAQNQLRPPRSNGETFMVFTYIWQKDVAKISKVIRAQCNVNPARAITWLVGFTIYCRPTIFNKNPLPHRQFLSDLFKKILKTF